MVEQTLEQKGTRSGPALDRLPGELRELLQRPAPA
jgi:hypothetical protein